MLATAGAKIQFVLSHPVADWQDYVCTAGARGVACGLWGTPGRDVLVQSSLLEVKHGYSPKHLGGVTFRADWILASW